MKPLKPERHFAGKALRRSQTNKESSSHANQKTKFVHSDLRLLGFDDDGSCLGASRGSGAEEITRRRSGIGGQGSVRVSVAAHARELVSHTSSRPQSSSHWRRYAR